MKSLPIFRNDTAGEAGEMIDQDGVAYHCADHKNVDELLDVIGNQLQEFDLELRVGTCGDDNHWVAVVPSGTNSEVDNMIYGVEMGELEMRPFEASDWDAFAGAESPAFIGECNFETPDTGYLANTTGFVIVADSQGLTMYGTGDDNEEIIFDHPKANSIVSALKIISEFMGPFMTSANILEAGFVRV